MRRNSRDLAFKFIYESFFNQAGDVDFTVRENDFIKYSKEEFDFAIEIFNKYKTEKETIMLKITNSLKNYTIDRVFKIDLALLCLLITEVDYIKTPLPVVANEILELSKIYSTEKSSKFLNGIIKSIYGEKNA